MGLGGSKPVEFDANAYIARAHEIFQKEKRGEEIRWQDIAELFSRTLTDEELAMILKNKEGREVLRRGGALARTFYHDKGQLQAVDTTRGVATQVTRVIEILYRAGLKEEGKAFGQEVCADAKKHRVGKTAVPYWEGAMRSGESGVEVFGVRKGVFPSGRKAVRDRWDFFPMVCPGGAAEVAARIRTKQSGARIGVGIAANSGLPCGSIAHTRCTDGELAGQLQATTQEESVMANAMLTSFATERERGEFLRRLNQTWGLRDHSGTMTRQGVDFTRATKPEDYDQAYVVHGCSLSGVQVGPPKMLDGRRTADVTLVFADSVNAGARGKSSESTMTRTLNAKASNDYDFFRACVKTKLAAMLDGMIVDGVTQAIIPLLSVGIYAGPHRDRIAGDYKTIVAEVLAEPIGPDKVPRGCFLQAAILPFLTEEDKRRAGL